MFDFGLPRASLGIFPTPLHRLDRIGRLLNTDQLYIKRDDLTGLGLGGNKTRSLEFLLGDALSKGADTIITAGGLQSNLCCLTAAACARLGLDCHLVHNDHEPDTFLGNMLLNRLFGAKSVFAGPMDEDTRAKTCLDLADRLRATGRHPYIVENGASVPMGALGYAEAAKEISQQNRTMGIDLRHVIIVGAMGGTASGLVYGAWLLDAPFHVHVVSVEYPAEHLRRLLDGLLDGMICLTGLKPTMRLEDVMTVHDEYLGEGYAIPTPESRDSLYAMAANEGILLEDVYTSKTFSGLAGLLRTRIIPPDEACCYVHTGGMGALFAQKI